MEELFQSISDDVEIGEGTKIFKFVNLYGCKIGSNCKVGTFVEVQKNASIGDECKISSHTFICEGVEIGNRVFIGHGVTFINDMYPRATNESGELQSEADWKVVKTKVGEGVSIGSGATILGGVEIGKNALIGAGSVVTKDVAENTIVVGNPARFVRKID